MSNVEQSIEDGRKRVTDLTNAIAALVGERNLAVVALGINKRAVGAPVVDLAREGQLRRNLTEQALPGLDTHSAGVLTESLFEMGRHVQRMYPNRLALLQASAPGLVASHAELSERASGLLVVQQ